MGHKSWSLGWKSSQPPCLLYLRTLLFCKLLTDNKKCGAGTKHFSNWNILLWKTCWVSWKTLTICVLAHESIDYISLLFHEMPGYWAAMSLGCRSPSILQKSSDFHLTALPIYSPASTSIISPAVTWLSQPICLPQSTSLISHTPYTVSSPLPLFQRQLPCGVLAFHQPEPVYQPAILSTTSYLPTCTWLLACKRSI